MKGDFADWFKGWALKPGPDNMHAIALAAWNAAKDAAASNAARRLAWLHSTKSDDVDGYCWGVFRVKWENGQVAQVLQTLGDMSDLDAAMAQTGVTAPACEQCGGTGQIHATDGTGPWPCYACDEGACRSCTQDGSRLVCTAGDECVATSNTAQPQ